MKKSFQGAFLSVFTLVFLLATFASVYFASPSKNWPARGVFILMFGPLTLINAPFDWFAIGLTRALLRRGLAPSGRGPYFYALVDALVAPPTIALLAVVTVVAVQTFGDIAVLRAQSPDARILPLADLFQGLEERPGDPEFWWVWLTLFSTLIPSLVNIAVAAAAFLRGLPFLNDWILRRMPIGKAMFDGERLRVAVLLAGQLAGGLLITGAAFYFIAAWFIPLWLPTVGAYIRDFSEAVAAYNAPARIIIWLFGGG